MCRVALRRKSEAVFGYVWTGLFPTVQNGGMGKSWVPGCKPSSRRGVEKHLEREKED